VEEYDADDEPLREISPEIATPVPNAIPSMTHGRFSMWARQSVVLFTRLSNS
jgi:hypothetical protein